MSLTFSLDLIHADCILGVERPYLTGRQRVSSLNTRGHRVRRRLHELDERLRACNRHGAAALLQNFYCSLSLHAPHQNNFSRTLTTKNVECVFIEELLFSGSFTFDYWQPVTEGRSEVGWIIRGKAPISEGSERSWIDLTFKRCHLFEKSIQSCISHRKRRLVINVHRLAANQLQP